MELIRAIKESEVGETIAVFPPTRAPRSTSRSGSTRPATSWSRSRPRRLRRDRRHQGPVAACPAAGPHPRRRRRRHADRQPRRPQAQGRSPPGRRRSPSSTPPAATLPARLHVHRHGPGAGREARALRAPAPRLERRPRRRRDREDRHRGFEGQLVNGEVLGFDHLVIATGARILPELIADFDTEAHHFYTPAAQQEAPGGARRLHGRQSRDRDRRDPVQVPAGAPRGRLPRRGRAARAGPPRQDEDPLPLADQPRLHDRERQRDGDPDLRGEGDRPPAPRRASTRSTRSARS